MKNTKYLLGCITLWVGLLGQSYANQAVHSFQAIESHFHGQLGVYAIDTQTHHTSGIHEDLRFPMDSTWKFMLVSAILKKSESRPGLLDQPLHYTQHDLVTDWSPVTSQHISTGMTISKLCEAALQFSDNGAANLLLKLLGGPTALNQFARSIGDAHFTLNHDEPKVNAAIPGSSEDTTTPKAMAKSLDKTLLGNALPPALLQTLQAWMKGNTTGLTQMRAGLPKGWIVADKTGSGPYGVTNDIGVIWPPQCKPIVLTVYFRTDDPKAMGPKDGVIAAATRTAIADLAKTDACLHQDLYQKEHILSVTKND